MESTKPLSGFVDEGYGLNTLIEASLKTNQSAKAFELFETWKELANGATFISLIKHLSYEPDSKEKVFGLMEEMKVKNDEFTGFVNTLLESLIKSKQFTLIADIIQSNFEVKIQTQVSNSILDNLIKNDQFEKAW